MEGAIKTLNFKTDKGNPCLIHVVREAEAKEYKIMLDIPTHPTFGDPKPCAWQPHSKGSYISLVYGKGHIFPSKADYVAVESFFIDVHKHNREIEAEHYRHQVKIFLAVDYSSDFGSFYWIGDDRTPIDQIMAEAAAQLEKNEIANAAEVAREAVTKWIEKRMAIQAANEVESARKAAVLAQVKAVEVGKCRTRRGSDGDDLECPVTVTALDGQVYRATFTNIFDAGMWTPQDWPQEALAAAIEMLPQDMKQIRM